MTALQPWIINALLAMLFAGLTAVLAKFGMKNVSGDTALTVRTSFIFLFVWLNAIAFRHVRGLSILTRRDILFLGLSGAMTFLSWLFYYRAMKDGNVSVVATIDKASIVITILLSFWLLKEPFTWRIAAGASLITAGLLVMVWK